MSRDWLVRLYPRAWRDRYGEEFRATIADQRATPMLILDIVLGAIDARIHSNSQLQASTTGDLSMMNLHRRCHASTSATSRDHFLAGGVTVASTAVFTILWLVLKRGYGETPWVEAAGVVLFPAALVLSMPFAYTKGWPARTQAFFIVSALAVLVGVTVLLAVKDII